MTSAAVDTLGPGVGRVPRWWMEITPHYVLDLEQEAVNRLAEENMGYFYEQMDRCKDGHEFLGPDGRPIIGADDGKPLRGLPNTWGGRETSGGSGSSGGSSNGGCLGRNFKVGTVSAETLALLGISTGHPDYQSFLKGSKMPPGYWDLLSALGYEGIANNLKQTSFGRYGRQADQPKFKPAWATNKLRSTDSGAKIRQGQYDDSPNKFSRRVVTNVALAQLEASGTPLETPPAQHQPTSSSSSHASAERQPSIKASRQSSKVVSHGEEPTPAEDYQDDYYDKDDDGEGDAEEYDEEEVVEEEEDYDNEQEEPPTRVDAEVEDLQKILAQKMAELARLQAGG